MNPDHPQSSPLVDLKDPIQVHLLTETALSDAKNFEILSQEEVDSLKKQIQSLTMRIEQTRANLAIQSKYRDAASSMARLYNPSKDGKRRSLLGNRMSDSAKEAEMEKQASERRCEELAKELFSLEKRLMEPQRRLLQHTAGILQLTHRASAKKTTQAPVGPPMQTGIPGSPESLYTYSNNRDSLELPNDELEFDERSMYLPLDDGGHRRKNTIEIPMKSPIREQNAQLRELREELERIKEENERILEENIELKTAERELRERIAQLEDEQRQLLRTEEQLRGEYEDAKAEAAQLREECVRIRDEASRMQDESSRLREADARLRAIEETVVAQTEGQQRTIGDTEKRLEMLNRQLRDIIVAFNPEENSEFAEPKPAAGSGETLRSQLEYLERALVAAAEEQKVQAEAIQRAQATEAQVAEASSTLGATQAALTQAYNRVQALARQMQLVVQQAGGNNEQLVQPPVSGTLDEHLDYIEDALRSVTSELTRALEESSTARARKQSIDQVDAVLMGLWEIIRGDGESPRRAEDSDGDVSGGEFDAAGYANEPYSLQAFSTKVQWLYAQATSLREQKYILQRQIKQQRELNNRSESEKDLEIQAKTEELHRTQMLLEEADQAARHAQAQLQRVLADMETLQKSNAANDEALQEQLREKATRISALESELRAAREQLAAAEAQISSLQTELSSAATSRADLETKLTALESQLAASIEAAQSADATVAQLRRDLSAKDEELDSLNSMVVELKTEVAIAKAELDGAYGTRKQRAAEAAALANSAAEERLRKELESALRDLEEITRESIKAEKERLELEGRLDEAEARRRESEEVRGRLEKEVEMLREELDRERLKPPPTPTPMSTGPAAGAAAARSAGANMLSEQFRAAVKEERKRWQEELKVCFYPTHSRIYFFF